MTTTDETEIPDSGGPAYPDTSVGMLMQQRDAARASATAARGEAARFEAMAEASDATAARLQVAIDALGGDEPIGMLPDPNAPQDTLDPSE